MRLLLIVAVIWGYFWAKRNNRLPTAFGPKPFHISARNTAIFGLALTVLIFFVALFTAGDEARLWKSVLTMLPTAMLFLLPLSFVVYRLRREPDNAGLAMGIAFPAAILLMGAYGLHDKWVHGDSDAQKEVFFGLLFAFAIPAWGLFLYVMVPTLLRLMYKSIRAVIALNPGARPNLAAVAGFALMSAVGYNSAWSTGHKIDSRGSSENYRVDKMEETIDPLYLCLWQFGSDDPAGPAFPDSIGATRIFAGSSGQRLNCERVLRLLPDRPYTLEYERSNRHAFRMTLTEKTWRNKPVHKAWVDQTGVMRTAVTIDGKLDSVRVENPGSLVHLLMVQRKIEEYAAKNPRHEYPRQLLRSHYLSDTLPPGSLALKTFKDCYGWDIKTGSCVETSDGRHVIYGTNRDSTGKPVYVLMLLNDVSMRPEGSESLNTDVGERFRSYLRDESGALHAYGGTRDASRDDPPPQPDELARPQERLESWWQTLRHDEVYDSLGKVRWDSARKFRADSAKKDSVSRELSKIPQEN